ncbi:hypothetical protein Tdes44962_MAKER05666 [Teratosphaeria destructans]|uniref:RING-type domain-containing protein n=1 Tax=Teratosphaeria destructans TaxID=418781 RepID=A0A9W7SJC8_9PEZI|nr:hypothetical protein Tdes44962_MAKER05666 [Teratosphaeria destructans]
MPTATTTTKAAVTVEHHEIHPHPPPDLATCSLFTAYGVHPDLSAWFNRTCASRLHLSTNHDLGLGDDDHHHHHHQGPNCAICQDTTAGCFLYLPLPCCHQVVGDECLLAWFLGGDITHRRARAAKKPARTTCPCCRADLLPPPAVTPATWEDAQEDARGRHQSRGAGRGSSIDASATGRGREQLAAGQARGEAEEAGHLGGPALEAARVGETEQSIGGRRGDGVRVFME